jgi:hypothetical protein
VVALGNLAHGFPRFHRESDPSSIVQSRVIHASADLRERSEKVFKEIRVKIKDDKEKLGAGP